MNIGGVVPLAKVETKAGAKVEAKVEVEAKAEVEVEVAADRCFHEAER